MLTCFEVSRINSLDLPCVIKNNCLDFHWFPIAPDVFLRINDEKRVIVLACNSGVVCTATLERFFPRDPPRTRCESDAVWKDRARESLAGHNGWNDKRKYNPHILTWTGGYWGKSEAGGCIGWLLAMTRQKRQQL